MSSAGNNDIRKNTSVTIGLSRGAYGARFYDSFFTNEFAKLETARCERYGSLYSIILIQIGGFDNGDREPTKKELDDFMKVMVSEISDVVRNCDVAGLIEERKILIVLPQTDYLGSLITIKKLTRALEPVTVKGKPYASLIFTQATYPQDAKGYGELLNVAMKRIEASKDSLWERDKLRTRLFWEVVAHFTGGTLSGSDHNTFELGSSEKFGHDFLEKINRVIVEDIGRNSGSRGILYIAPPKITTDMPILNTIATAGKTATKIFVVGTKKDPELEMRNATGITITDPRMSGFYFTFFINAKAAYAIICKEVWGDIYTCFHTSNPYIVEGLITKFQRDSMLQEQL